METKFYSYDNRKKRRAENIAFGSTVGVLGVDSSLRFRETFGYKFTFQHTGLANARTKDQLFSFAISLRDAGYDDCPIPQSWLEAFSLLSHFLKNSTDEKKIIKDIVLIICGSATSWIINKVINDYGGLHNRVTQRIALQPFTLRECEMFAQNRGLEMSRYQIAECYMVLGGIPFYWSMLEKGLSLAQNIDKIFFAKNGKLSNEFSWP